MPSLSSSSGFGRCWIFCSRLSARMCFASSFCFSCNEGAAVESGRMFPIKPGCQKITYLIHCPEIRLEITNVQLTPPSQASSPTPSSDDQPPADARALLVQLELIYYPISLDTLIPPPIKSHTVQHWYHARYSCSSSLGPRGAFAGVSRAILDARLGRVASGRHWGSKIHAPCLATMEALDEFKRSRGKVGESRVWCFESFGGAREIGLGRREVDCGGTRVSE